MPKAKQPSRKSKSAWRKNIDLEVVEASLERKRAAERLGQEVVHGGTEASSIFVEDRRGDDKIASKVGAPAKKGLRSLEILANTSGASGLTSRVRKGGIKAAAKTGGSGSSTSDGVPSMKSGQGRGGLTPEQRAVRAGMSKKEIERLRRAVGRDVRGAFGVVVDENEEDIVARRGVEALIAPSTYNVWAEKTVPDLKWKKRKEYEVNDKEGWSDTLKSIEIQLPASYVDATKKSRSKTLSMPDPGQSYNPAAEAHEALLSRAIEEVEREEEKRRLELEWKKTWDLGAKEARGKGENPIEDLVGLKVGQGEGDDEDLLEQTNEEDEESEIEEEIKEIKRKTKQQKAKAKKLKEEIRARMALKASKRSKSDLQSLRTFKKQLMAVEREKAKLAEKRREAREKRLEEKVGVYKIPKRDEEVQLGEDLAEGLRLLKPEGNLLNDRLHSFQKQGIIEPKKRDTLSKRRGSSMRGKKEYETHAYKRFV